MVRASLGDYFGVVVLTPSSDFPPSSIPFLIVTAINVHLHGLRWLHCSLSDSNAFIAGVARPTPTATLPANGVANIAKPSTTWMR